MAGTLSTRDELVVPESKLDTAVLELEDDDEEVVDEVELTRSCIFHAFFTIRKAGTWTGGAGAGVAWAASRGGEIFITGLKCSSDESRRRSRGSSGYRMMFSNPVAMKNKRVDLPTIAAGERDELRRRSEDGCDILGRENTDISDGVLEGTAIAVNQLYAKRTNGSYDTYQVQAMGHAVFHILLQWLTSPVLPS